MMETTEPKMATNTCACGSVYEHESIPFGKSDMGLTLFPKCPACMDALAKDVLAVRKAREREEYRARVLAIIPPELLPVWLDPLGTDLNHPDFNPEKWEEVKKWRPGPHGNGLGLIGGAGACKTRILALLAEKIIMQGVRLKWTSAMDMHTEALNRRSKERKLAFGAMEYFQECMNASYLVIDDLGNNEWCPAFESQLFTILDHRMNHRLPVLWSSNKPPEEFHLEITSVNPSALIGRLLNRTSLLNFDDKTLL